MLTSEQVPDLKFMLNISLFLTLPHLLDCLICTRNAMSIVLLLQLMGDRLGSRWLIYFRVWVGGRMFLYCVVSRSQSRHLGG